MSLRRAITLRHVQHSPRGGIRGDNTGGRKLKPSSPQHRRGCSSSMSLSFGRAFGVLATGTEKGGRCYIRNVDRRRHAGCTTCGIIRSEFSATTTAAARSNECPYWPHIRSICRERRQISMRLVSSTSKETSKETEAEDGRGRKSGTASGAAHSMMSNFLRVFGTLYVPRPDERPFLERLQVQRRDGVEVSVAVPGGRESRRFFGVPLARRGIQPVWVEVDNLHGTCPLYLDRVSLDPNYYTPREAALRCHFASFRRLAGVGLLSWAVYLPLAFALPLKLLTAGAANRRMDDFFCGEAFPLGPIPAGESSSGFVFATVDYGTKVVPVDLICSHGREKFVFSLPVPGIAVDHEGRTPSLETLYPGTTAVDCDEEAFKKRIQNEPRATTNRSGDREGDPANLVVVGDFPTILAAFGSRWDETETISLGTCVKTARAFVLGSQYRYSPVSSLYMYGRSQDFALQKARDTINERLHLRLWLTTARFEGKPIWVGQVSRDIGVRPAWTWNLTTHRIDASVDEARNYVVADLLRSGHLDRVAFVDGVGASSDCEPRRNLTGDPFVTDGRRAVVILSPTRTDAKLLDW